jgi:hypothetical protein
MDEFNAWIKLDIANSKFTWSNKRREPTLVKLDRVLVNLAWSQKFLHSECRTLLRQTSDHKPIMLDTANTTPRTTCFRYEDYWLQNGELVAITRDKLARGTRNMAIATRINHRLRTIRAATRAWLKNNRNQKIIRANLGHTKLFFDAVEEWRTLSNYEFALRLVCSQKLQNLNLEESKHWRRRAKIKWCTLGDENTKFFHTMATYRYRKSKIKVLCHDQEELFDDSAKIAIATNFFTRLFREDRGWIPNIDLSRLYGQDRSDLLDLDAPFTWQEIEKAINNAPSGRNPGPDGFTNEFFKFYKAEMKDELLELFQALYAKEIKLDGLNLASIALLPKRSMLHKSLTTGLSRCNTPSLS